MPSRSVETYSNVKIKFSKKKQQKDIFHIIISFFSMVFHQHNKIQNYIFINRILLFFFLFILFVKFNFILSNYCVAYFHSISGHSLIQWVKYHYQDGNIQWPCGATSSSYLVVFTPPPIDPMIHFYSIQSPCHGADQ